METTILNYHVVVEPDTYTGTDEPCFTAYCYELGIADGGDTIEEALERIKDAIECYESSPDEEKTSGTSIVLPSDNRTLTTGTVKMLIAQLGISVDEFLKLL